jgi:O-antigen/teichoic acid export membrane protein
MGTSSQVLKIYFYRMLSLLVGFASLLIVLPLLSSDVGKYAIYAISMSLCIFLTYGDFGFLAACQKYCAEAVGRNSVSEESKYLGFTVSLLMVAFSIFSLVMFLVALHPEIIIPELDEEGSRFASKMFLTIGLLMPIQVICQRLIYLILSVRLKDYLFSRVDVLVNLSKIAIVPLFVREDEFLLLEYFVATILLSLVSCLIGFFIIRNSKIFPLLEIFKNLRFSKKIFDETKYLALSMMISTIFWIMYYELDLIIAAQFFSISDVAYYALAFTFINYLRSLWVAGFAPFLPLLNIHFGSGNISGVKNISSSLVLFTTPLFIIVSLLLGKHMEQIIIYWVGHDFMPSAEIVGSLICGIALVGFTNVAAHYMTTFKLYRTIVIFGAGPLLIYYGAFGSLMYFTPEAGILNLAYAKALSGLGASFMGAYLLVAHKIIDFRSLVRMIFFSTLGLIGLFYMPAFISFDLVNQEPNIKALALLLMSIGVAIIVIFIAAMAIFRPSRSLLIQLSNNLIGVVKLKI